MRICCPPGRRRGPVMRRLLNKFSGTGAGALPSGGVPSRGPGWQKRPAMPLFTVRGRLFFVNGCLRPCPPVRPRLALGLSRRAGRFCADASLRQRLPLGWRGTMPNARRGVDAGVVSPGCVFPVLSAPQVLLGTHHAGSRRLFPFCLDFAVPVFLCGEAPVERFMLPALPVALLVALPDTKPACSRPSGWLRPAVSLPFPCARRGGRVSGRREVVILPLQLDAI